MSVSIQPPQTQRLLASGIQFGEIDGIPWRVAENCYRISASDMETIRQLTEDCFRFLTVVAHLIRDGEDLGKLIVDVLRGIHAGRLELALQSFNAHPQPLGMVRPDIVRDEDGAFRIVETETMIGGLGMGVALRKSYDSQSFPGNSPAYADMMHAFWRTHPHAQSFGRQEQLSIAVINPASKDQYDAEFGLLAEAMAAYGINMVVGRPQQLNIAAGQVSLDGQPIHAIHRFFRVCELDRNSLELIGRIVRKRYIPIVQPWIEILEDKALFAFLHDHQMRREWINLLGFDAYKRLIQAVPMTRIVSQDPSLVRQLYTARPGERAYWLKCSGDTWGGRGTFFGKQLSTSKWQQQLTTAWNGWPEGQVWILQDHTPAARESFSVYNTETGSFENELLAVRYTPFAFWDGEGVEIGDFFVTARKDDKVHGSTDATMTPVEVV